MLVDQPTDVLPSSCQDDNAARDTVFRLCYEIPLIKKVYSTCRVPPSQRNGFEGGFSFTAKVLLNKDDPQQHLAEMLEVYNEPVVVADVRLAEDMAPLPDGKCLLLHCSLV